MSLIERVEKYCDNNNLNKADTFLCASESLTDEAIKNGFASDVCFSKHTVCLGDVTDKMRENLSLARLFGSKVIYVTIDSDSGAIIKDSYYDRPKYGKPGFSFVFSGLFVVNTKAARHENNRTKNKIKEVIQC